MISKIINNFSNYFILNSKDYLVGQNLIDDVKVILFVLLNTKKKLN